MEGDKSHRPYRPHRPRRPWRPKPTTNQTEPVNSASTIQSESSENQLKTNTLECMICCDNIHRTQPIWYCMDCYNIFHLKCAIEWCNKSIRTRNESMASAQYPSLGQSSGPLRGSSGINSQQTPGGSTSYEQERSNSVEWPCPACRKVLHFRPGKYKCFCGKVVRPEVNRHLTPHSCGQLCGRKRPNAECPHDCNSMCHPGRCNPCTLSCRKTCHCGKESKEVRCSVEVGSCGQICGKPLNCGEHTCAKACHSGTCSPCDMVLSIKCYCATEETQERCDSKSSRRRNKGFSCDKICDKILDCGKHRCAQRCHPGPGCSSCKLLSANIKTCPCGSTSIKSSILNARSSCTDPLPTCGNKCNRNLICGPDKSRHKCQRKCHVGSCPPCKLKSSVRCQCSSSTRTIDCSLMFERVVEDDQVYFKQTRYTFNCETRCNTPKNCVRHRCQNKCCIANKDSSSRLHVCDQKCNKKLACGQHNCMETCHPGQCGDCTNIGWEELRCHCGGSTMYPPIPCGAKPPTCHRACRRAHDCGHPVKHECHDDTELCAPCTVFVKKSCFCGADSKDSVYCYKPGYSCGRACKKQLSCRQHTCKRICHENECETPNSRGAIICSQPCPVPRYICKHPCAFPCHGKTPCPVSDCKRIIEISCNCGNRTERIECHKLTRDVDNRNKMAMLSMNRPNQDSVIVDLSSKPSVGPSTQDNASKKRLDCDESCSIYKRNKALAEALDIAQPDLKPASTFGEDPLKLLKEATAHDYKFVSATYSSLTKFIKSAKESDKRFIFMQFPPTDNLRREVIHELAFHFSCTSESRGEEPQRHVVVRAYKNKSVVPDFTIEQLLPVTD